MLAFQIQNRTVRSVIAPLTALAKTTQEVDMVGTKATARSSLTQERLKQDLLYDPETGEFWRRVVPRTVGNYCYITVRGCARVLAHRLAWLYMTGEWPIEVIDHKNGNRKDNRFANLRDVSRSVNNQNKRTAAKKNRSGFLGVCPNGKGWMAQIGIDGKSNYIGTFKTPEEAHAAYLKRKRASHPGCTI